MARFQERLAQLYRTDPSRYAPFAFWKMQKMTGEGEALYDESTGCLYAIRNGQLLFYHSADERRFPIPMQTLNGLDFMILRMRDFVQIRDSLEGFNLSSGWTLYLDLGHVGPSKPAEGYEAAGFDFGDDASFTAAANLLNRTIYGTTYDFAGGDYPAWCFHPDRLRRWTALPAFDPSLWIWIRERRTREPVAFGVSTYHGGVRETDLDWIYVLPEHRGRGVGTALIAETVRRAIGRSDVIRVGGVADGFYKKCGFYERELWGVAARPGFSFNEQ
jgi:GNAT superfamily N-acetyltransferase